METSRCRGCGAEIRWVITPNGKRMPLDVKPIQNAYVLEEVEGDDGTPTVKPAMVWASHFTTCPDASRFSRGGSPSKR